MTPILRPAELDDLDRADMETMTTAEFARRQANLWLVTRDRFAAEAHAARLVQERQEERTVRRFAWGCLLGSLAIAGLTWYLGRAR